MPVEILAAQTLTKVAEEELVMLTLPGFLCSFLFVVVHWFSNSIAKVVVPCYRSLDFIGFSVVKIENRHFLFKLESEEI